VLGDFLGCVGGFFGLCWGVRVIGYFISLNTSFWIGYFVVVLRDFLGCVGC
jgi:hypothetical protein